MDGRFPLDTVMALDDGEARGEQRPAPPDATFHLMAEAMPQLVWSTTPDGRHDYFNARWYDYTGMRRPDGPDDVPAAPRAWSWREYIHPADVDRTVDAWTRSLQSGEPFEAQYRFREGATGAYRWFLARAVPLRDDEGRIVRWFGTCTDVDDAKRTEDALAIVARAGELLGSTLAAEDALAGMARLAVPALADWCAVDLAEPGPDGAPVARRVAVAHVDPAKVALANALAERYPDDPDAPYGVPYVLRTGRPDMMREIPAALIQAGARDAEHLAVIESLGLRSYIVVPILDAAGEIGTLGRRPDAPDTRRVLGAITLVTAESGRCYAERDLGTATELARRGALALERARLYEGAVRDRERLVEQSEELATQNERLQDQAAELEMQAQQLHEQATELEVSQEQLQEQAAELEASNEQLQSMARELALRIAEQVRARQEVERARAEAEAARERAEEANRAKSEFLASMSHELRTPLNAIGGYAELMELGVRGAVTDAQREDLARIRRSQRHLLTLINDILNFARIEGGRVEYDIRVHRLADVVADVAPMIGPQIAAQQLSYEERLPTDAGVEACVRADPEKVRQILLNLLSNAVKFTPSGGRVRVEIALPPERPDVALVHVADTGIGIPRDKLESVFDAFVQVHAGLTRRHEGTGLGLAISRDLARGMGGDLTVESEPGVGSTFTLALPRA